MNQQDWNQESSPDGQGYVGDSPELPHSSVLDIDANGSLLILASLFLLVTHCLLALFHSVMAFFPVIALLGCTGAEPRLRNHLVNCPRSWTRCSFWVPFSSGYSMILCEIQPHRGFVTQEIPSTAQG